MSRKSGKRKPCVRHVRPPEGPRGQGTSGRHWKKSCGDARPRLLNNDVHRFASALCSLVACLVWNLQGLRINYASCLA
jgi:hypothetical protein